MEFHLRLGGLWRHLGWGVKPPHASPSLVTSLLMLISWQKLQVSQLLIGHARCYANCRRTLHRCAGARVSCSLVCGASAPRADWLVIRLPSRLSLHSYRWRCCCCCCCCRSWWLHNYFIRIFSCLPSDHISASVWLATLIAVIQGKAEIFLFFVARRVELLF